MAGKGVNGGEMGMASLGLIFWGHGNGRLIPPEAAAALAAAVNKGLVFGIWGSLKEALFDAPPGRVPAAEAAPAAIAAALAAAAGPPPPLPGPGGIVGLRPSCCV